MFCPDAGSDGSERVYNDFHEWRLRLATNFTRTFWAAMSKQNNAKTIHLQVFSTKHNASNWGKFVYLGRSICRTGKRDIYN